MRVIFERVDGRRYRIGIRRDGRFDVGADIPVRAAPGGADTPHDLVHFVVEEQARLRLGIYGQIAAGGDVGGFFTPAPADRHAASDSKRSHRLGRAGNGDVARSELLAALASSGRIPEHIPSTVVEPSLRENLNARLETVLKQWRATPCGGRLVLTWPDDLTIRNGRIPAG